MRLHPNWRALLRHAWSIRFLAIATVLSGLEVALPVFTDDPPIPRAAFAALAFAVTVLAAVARLVAQKGITPETEP